ncbi:MAG: transaldolase [Phycisphaerales bacterium]
MNAASPSAAGSAAPSARATAILSMCGQSIWVDNITRAMLNGTLQTYIQQWSVVGLTSNPTIFSKAIKGSADYDAQITELAAKALKPEEIFFDLALTDLLKACDLFRVVFTRTGGVDGWCSLEVSPLLAYDTRSTVDQAVQLHARADRPNLFIKVPGTKEGLPAIEELTYRGVSVNVTLLFSPEQWRAAAEAYLKGLERRAAERKSLDVSGVASLFISRWDTLVDPKLPPALQGKAGIAVGQATYAEYIRLFSSERWLALQARGARPQRLLYASTSTKEQSRPPCMYVEGLASPLTVNTMPENTLKAFYEGGTVGALVPTAGTEARATLAAIEAAGQPIEATGLILQQQGAKSFDASWNELIADIASKAGTLRGR